MIHPSKLGRAALGAAPYLLFAVASRGQCANAWQAGVVPAVAGTNHAVYDSTMWDPDGAGPLPAQLVIVGEFTEAGGNVANGVATLDPQTQTWESLGGGVVGGAFCVMALPSGELLVGGSFQTAGAQSIAHVARWNGTSWSGFGSGPSNWAYHMSFGPNGDLFVANEYSGEMSRWNGSVWTQVLPLTVAVDITGMVEAPNRDLIVVGYFNSIGGVSAEGAARFNGSTWQSMGPTPGLAPYLSSVAQTPSGDLYAGRGYSGVAHWDGTSWTNVPGAPPTSNVEWLPSGRLCAIYESPSAAIVQTFDGVSWTTLLNSASHPSQFETSTELPNGDLALGGAFINLQGQFAQNIGRFDGANWSTLVPSAAPPDGPVYTLEILPDGRTIMGGAFSQPGAGLAALDGSHWGPYAVGVNSVVYDLLVEPNGDVIVAGNFTQPTSDIFRWNGTVAQPLGNGIQGTGAVRSVARLPNGDLVAVGDFLAWPQLQNAALWDGSSWSPLAGLPNGKAVVTLPDGSILAAGAQGVLYRWTGTSWTAEAPHVGGEIRAMLVTPDGDIIVGGTFVGIANRIAKWDGLAWSSFGSGMNSTVSALALAENGDLLAAGAFTNAGGVAAQRIARWNGVAWSAVDGGLDLSVRALMVGNGHIAAGGFFSQAGTQASSFFAKTETSCPASTADLGGGCPSSGGANALVANAPWAGANWTAAATGLPSTGIACHVLGFSAVNLPLASLLPQGQPGCVLLAAPDVVGFGVSPGGSTSFTLNLPSDPALAGSAFHSQVVSFELDLAGHFVATTSSNALRMVVGFY